MKAAKGLETKAGSERRQNRTKLRWSAEMERRATERSRVRTHGGVDSGKMQRGGTQSGGIRRGRMQSGRVRSRRVWSGRVWSARVRSGRRSRGGAERSRDGAEARSAGTGPLVAFYFQFLNSTIRKKENGFYYISKN